MSGKYAVSALALLVALAGGQLSSAAQATSQSMSKSASQPAGQKFIKEAIRGNLAEVKVGQLAQDKGASQGVKDFGAALVKDHEKANQDATQAAQQMNVTPPDKPAMKEQATYTKLAALSGKQFDRQFIKAMVKDHKEDIAKYQQEANKTGPAADYAKQALPTLKAHLKMAEDLERGEHVASTSESPKAR
jgi:putative membrane protein